MSPHELGAPKEFADFADYLPSCDLTCHTTTQC